MMSNGPCSCRWSFQSGSRSIVAASTSSGESSTKTCRKPSRCEPAQRPRRSWRCWLRTTCGPKSRSGRVAVPLLAELLGEVQHDRDRQQWYCARQLDQRLAGLGLDVRGVDDRQPPSAEPLAGDEVQQRRRRRSVTAWSFSSSLDQPAAGVRREDLGGRKCLRANVHLPEPGHADSTTSESCGISSGRALMSPPAVSIRDASRCQTPATKLQHRAVRTRSSGSASWNACGRGDRPVSDTSHRSATGKRRQGLIAAPRTARRAAPRRR